MTRPAVNIKVAVTGAAGYLGSRLCDHLAGIGATVVRLSRRRPEDRPGDGNWMPFSLDQCIPADALRAAGIDALVHCAYDFTARGWADICRVNVEGSIRLLCNAREAGVPRIVHISSMSAFDGCRSEYGKAKLRVEREALSLGAAVVRPGLIDGPAPGGMLGGLAHLVARMTILPAPAGGNQTLYLAHERDLAELVERLCTDPSIDIRAPLIAANARGRSFGAILRLLAARQGRRRTVVPVPWRAIWAPLRAAEALGLGLGFRSDSVISLVNQDPRPRFDVFEKTGVAFRDAEPGIPAPSGVRCGWRAADSA